MPEQFWNCAEVTISEDCDLEQPLDPPTPPTTAAPVAAPPAATTGATAATTAATDSGGSGEGCVAIPQDELPEGSWATTDAECAKCNDGTHVWWPCDTNLCDCSGDGPAPPAPTPPIDPTPPTPPTPTPPTPPTPSDDGMYTADHGEDSRLIAYVGNWQPCPTAEQVDAYSHIVVAFSVSYTWAASGNICDPECNIARNVPICENQSKQHLVDEWRAKGKKVILSFGGAGMGGSWMGEFP